MIYTVRIYKDVLVDTDEELPMGVSDNMTDEEIDTIWDFVENSYISSTETIESVE